MPNIAEMFLIVWGYSRLCETRVNHRLCAVIRERQGDHNNVTDFFFFLLSAVFTAEFTKSYVGKKNLVNIVEMDLDAGCHITFCLDGSKNITRWKEEKIKS